jgi:hypothetical protein
MQKPEEKAMSEILSREEFENWRDRDSWTESSDDAIATIEALAEALDNTLLPVDEGTLNDKELCSLLDALREKGWLK